MTFPTPRGTFIALASIAVLAINTHGATVNVYIYDFDFSTDASHASALDPIINVGDTVHWIWDQGGHTTEAVPGQLEAWGSGGGSPVFTFDHTFLLLSLSNWLYGGAYDLHCLRRQIYIKPPHHWYELLLPRRLLVAKGYAAVPFGRCVG